jgi:hypothetical protein
MRLAALTVDGNGLDPLSFCACHQTDTKSMSQLPVLSLSETPRQLISIYVTSGPCDKLIVELLPDIAVHKKSVFAGEN